MNSYKTDLVIYLKTHPKEFTKLIKLAITNKQPYSQKASWLLWSCMKENDLRIRKYIKQIIPALCQKPDSQQRELLIVLEKMNLNSTDDAQLFNICAGIWQQTNKKPSIRYVAFRLMIKIARKYPGLAHEIELLADEMFIESLSRTARKSILRMVQAI